MLLAMCVQVISCLRASISQFALADWGRSRKISHNNSYSRSRF